MMHMEKYNREKKPMHINNSSISEIYAILAKDIQELLAWNINCTWNGPNTTLIVRYEQTTESQKWLEVSK